MRFSLFLLCCLLATNVSLGYTKVQLLPVKTKTAKAILKADSSALNIRQFNQDSLKAYSKKPEFQYKEAAQDISWWDRFWRGFWDWIAHLFSFNTKKLTASALFWQIVKILFLLLGAAALIVFILKAAGIDVKNLFSRKSTNAPIPYSEFFEDINTIDFDTEIENAVAKHNYRFAVRLQYLKCLKQLSDADLIDWQIDKTNNVYINELINSEQRSIFKILTYQFEYIWYGEFVINAAVYNRISGSFHDFNKQITHERL